jgi:hypothetical protein
VLEYEHAPYRRPLAQALLARLRYRYAGSYLFIVTRTAARAATFRLWAAHSGAYCGLPRQVAFSHAEAVAEHGLQGAFVDLEGKPWG